MNKIASLCATLINAETVELIEIVSNYRKDPGVFYRRYFEVALAVLSGRTCSAVGATRASEMFAVKVVDCLTREYADEADFLVVVLLGLTDLETELYSKSEVREWSPRKFVLRVKSLVVSLVVTLATIVTK